MQRILRRIKEILGMMLEGFNQEGGASGIASRIGMRD